MDSVKHASTPQPFFSKDCKFYALTLYIYNACASVTWGYDIVRKRNEEERERQSLERSLEPLEPFEPIEPIEPLEPIAASKTKTKINPLKRMEGDALLPNLPPWSYKSELLTPKPKACAPPSS